MRFEYLKGEQLEGAGVSCGFCKSCFGCSFLVVLFPCGRQLHKASKARRGCTDNPSRSFASASKDCQQLEPIVVPSLLAWIRLAFASILFSTDLSSSFHRRRCVVSMQDERKSWSHIFPISRLESAYSND